MLPVSHEQCPVTSSCVRHHAFVSAAYITRPRRGKQGEAARRVALGSLQQPLCHKDQASHPSNLSKQLQKQHMVRQLQTLLRFIREK